MAKYRLLERQEDNLLNHLLQARGVTEDDRETFLNPDYEKGRHDPFLLHDMEVAVDRLLLAIKNQEKIAIYSDYDCDGIPGAVILHDFFKAIGYDNFINYIPHRHFEGFGLSEMAVEKLANEGVQLIITIDCGTSDLEAADKAASLGVDLIITDHHEPKERLPVAVAIVNPRVGDSYPFPHICGAAVVFKLAEATLSRGDFEVKPGHEKWWLDMVGIATIGDMVPLIGENRVFAHFGLQVLRKSRRPGLQHLLRKARADQRYLTEDDIGFTIAPRINAASRMDSPEDAFLMLSDKEEGSAGARATHLEKLNNERKGMVASMTKELRRRMSEIIDLPDIIVMGNPEWRPALVGLCANGLAEEHNRPVFLWGRDGNGVIKGSCRSGSSISVVKIMEGAEQHFLEHGGHHASGGFAVKEDSVFHLGQALNDSYISLGDKALANEEVSIDAVLSLEDITRDLLSTLRSVAPYGAGNKKPLFAFKNVKPSQIEQFGKTKEHLKIIFETSNKKIEAIAFFAKPEQYQVAPAINESLTILAHVEESYFMNRWQTRLRIVDIVETI
ncbi:single-stranded-DNA-specific exonuclease RecJ [Candidatus Kaiserbacteria bacterium CG10_big_fil_rev_8_21_14_0_10_44_10]|uniref:Single-stranded-DNA-specific exonuclease RecJ n=1 Tax=Candidatus Kaiserbacteria bacterium CG10_big_fil_rev_8_21_14_0_10_44_10 TaxID=1974606 RepID=A0A2H0UGR5_9BACT|nr:MAG: single-stranded-DNA-specific exonuclease RecJ [Candidatus Kaiserbacteria bacterium CG10_big_fil_rev_8_21_14_0_10_44_10]